MLSIAPDTGKPQANPNQSNNIRLQTQVKTNTKEKIARAVPSTETNQKKWHGTTNKSRTVTRNDVNC